MVNELVLREYNGIEIPQRPDGYINATKMCQAGGKRWNDYYRQIDWEYIEALACDAGIPASQLIIVRKGNSSKFQQGTWVHPEIAVDLAEWISKPFKIIVKRWVLELIQGRAPVVQEASPAGALVNQMAALIEVCSRNSEMLESLNERVERLEQSGRLRPSPRTRQLLRAVVWRSFNGCCPVYRHIRILESEAEIVRIRGGCVNAGVFHHWHGRRLNAPDAMWLISREAQLDLDNSSDLRNECSSTFLEFQRLLAEHIAKTEGRQIPLPQN